MYFFDLADYIGTTRAAYPTWSGTTIMAGFLGLSGWRGLVGGDFEDFMTTARATRDAFIKAMNQYFISRLAMSSDVRQPGDSPISQLYYNDFQDARVNLFKYGEPYHNAYNASKRVYDFRIIVGASTGTYDEWLNEGINGPYNYIATGTTTETYTRPVYIPNGFSAITETYTITYGSVEDIKTIDNYYNEYKLALEDIIRVLKTAMVIADGDTFDDL